MTSGEKMVLIVILLVTILLQSHIQAVKIEKWNMHDMCGIEIGRYDQAGELHFDAESMPNYLPGNECRVTLFPALTVDSGSSVLFYFTEFSIGSYCEDTNVTVLDGGQSDPPLHVEGLPRAFCGKNATLVSADQVFTTTTRRLTVIFRRTDYGKRFPGKFVLKFVSFHKGPCTNDAVDDTSSIVTCSNGRCIASNLHCLENLNSCGGGENSTCTTVEDFTFTFLDSIKDIAKNVGIIVAIVIMVYMIRLVYKSFELKYGTIRNFPILREVFGTQNAPVHTGRRGSVSLSLTEPHQSAECVEQVAIGNNGDIAHVDNVSLESRISSESEFPEPPPYPSSHQDIVLSPVTPPAPTFDHYPQPSAPPSDEYYPPPSAMPPPSYEEVVANESKYISSDA